MFDDRDAAFCAVTSHPRRGPPELTPNGVVFRDDQRISFGRYDAFDARNPEFASTPSEPPLRPPVMLRDGTIAFRARNYTTYYKRRVGEAHVSHRRKRQVHSVDQNTTS
jgi:hypothetical protein